MGDKQMFSSQMTWGIFSHDDKVDFDATSWWFFTNPS